MPNLIRTVHPQTVALFGDLADLAPDIAVETGNGAGTKALVFVDEPERTTSHVFILDNAGVERVRSMLSGLAIVQNGRG